MTAVIVTIVIVGVVIGLAIQAAANQICRQVHHLHRRMDTIHEELQEANSHLSSIERDTGGLPRVRSSYIDDYPA